MKHSIRRGLLSTAVLLAFSTAYAAEPPNGTASEANPSVSWSGPVMASMPDVVNGPDCRPPSGANPCNDFELTIVPSNDIFEVSISLSSGPADDWDLEVYAPDGTLVGSSANGGSDENVTLSNPVAGTYTVSAFPFAVVNGYDGFAELTVMPDGGGNGGNGGNDAVSLSDINFINYAPPGGDSDPTFQLFGRTEGDPGVGSGAGEPTLGIPWLLNQNDGDDDLTRVMFIAGLQTVRMSFNDCPSPAVSTWEDVSVPFHATTLDPILEVDRATGRTLSSQLAGKTSLLGVSDDLGETWSPSQGAGINSGVDHQTIGHGPFSDNDPLNAANTFPTAFYYASQDIAAAQAAISRDGGITFGAGVPMYTTADCGSLGALHGHVQVSPLDGDVYVPTGTCPVAQSGVAVSEDGGATWRVEGVPGTQRGDDPGAGIDEAGNVYFAACDGDAEPIVSVRDAASGEWQETPTSLRGPIDFQQCVFPTVVAGSEGRAAVAFLGSTTPGPGTDAGSNFAGSFFMYVAVTYDKGENWEITNVTPNDPVQRGEVCLAGTTCPSNRNLLDFNDIQIDEIGRIVVGYADGCIGACVNGNTNSGTDAGRVARQQYGSRGLLAEFDDVLDPAGREPDPPFVEATVVGSSVELNWSSPFDGNSPLTGFDIFRKPMGGTFGANPIASVSASTLSFIDTLEEGAGDVCYQVVSNNAFGAARGCFEVCAEAPDAALACDLPGVTRGLDPADITAPDNVDFRALSVAQPFIGSPAACQTESPDEVIFTLAIENLATATPGNTFLALWPRQFPMTGPVGAGADDFDRAMVNARITENTNVITAECHYGNITAPSGNIGFDQVTLPAQNCLVRGNSIEIRVPVDVIDDCDVDADPNCSIDPDTYEIPSLEVRVFEFNQSGMPVSAAAANDVGVAAGYALIRNESCRPDAQPTARNDILDVAASGTTNLDVTFNDLIGDCDDLTIVNAGNGEFGQVAITADGNSLDYTANGGQFCVDVFTYTISDPQENVSTAQVRVENPACF